ncbi:Transitional endoplasmic reticulum ATPase TER94 [Gryllus bimaculatus]|nr:Transitional endoplasmic reticulum ATPase TER94 [Gryllus bimaculatus]
MEHMKEVDSLREETEEREGGGEWNEMKEEPFVVKYLTARNCYLHFSDYWSKRLSNLGALTSALRVDYKNGKHAFFSWNPQFLNADDDSVVRVSATYAQKLGIDDGEKAMNQDLLQSGLLDQIQIVWPGQTFVAWVGTSMHAVLNVDSVEPKSQIGRLQTLTEIIINSPSEKLAQGDILTADVQDEIKNEEQSATTEEEDREEDSYLPKTSSVVSFIWDSVQGISSRLWGKEEYEKDISRRSEHSVTNLLSEKLKLLEPLVYRVHPFQFADESKISSQFLHPYNAYIHKTNLLIPLLCARQSLVVKLVPVSFVSKSNTPGTEEEKKVNEKEKFLKLNSSDSVYVKLCIIDDLLNKTDEEMNKEINRVFDSGGQHCIFLPSAVRAALHVKTGARVRLEVDGTPFQQPVSLELMTIGRTCSPKDTESIWKKYMLQLCGESDILINSNSIVPVLSSDNTIHHMSVKILDPSVPYCLLTKSSLEKSKIKIGLSKSLGVSVPDDRLKILEKLLESKVSLKQTQIDLDSFAKKSDGYVVQDLVDFMEKAVFEAWKRKALAEDFSEGDPALQNEDLEKAFQVMKPLALRGVELVQDAGLCWADIGGLSDAKKLLVEMLEWPVQGPELLSKYIGASEEAVRTIFQKAQSAKPCVLFFDEFDSLAPRRGHDSTGVTDRVVNQLLTQLDGVEALNSVWVLAATSRPDLLDPALLRPGRLDSAVLCPLPTKEDRVAILQSLSRKLFLAEDVDLSSVAEKTEGFTGADLQAIIYSAQLAAEMLYIKDKNVKGPIRITQNLLLAALKDTRPSLNEKEQQKYKRIYEHFEKSRSSSSKGKKSISTTTPPPPPLQQKDVLNKLKVLVILGINAWKYPSNLLLYNMVNLSLDIKTCISVLFSNNVHYITLFLECYCLEVLHKITFKVNKVMFNLFFKNKF